MGSNALKNHLAVRRLVQEKQVKRKMALSPIPVSTLELVVAIRTGKWTTGLQVLDDVSEFGYVRAGSFDSLEISFKLIRVSKTPQGLWLHDSRESSSSSTPSKYVTSRPQSVFSNVSLVTKFGTRTLNI